MMEEATGHPGAEARQAGPRHAGFWEERTQGMRILAFGGSLRAGSLNRALLHEAVALMPPHSELDMSQLGVAGSLPLFNSDLVGDDSLPQVRTLKDALRAADGLLIATPEYNWGIPGFLKNAIDWASRPSADVPAVFGDLPVAVMGAGGGSGTRNAQTAWMSVFRYLRMRPWLDQWLFIDHAPQHFEDDGRLVDDATRELEGFISGFAAYCEQLPRIRHRRR
jgi:NAD(P)H-dependent FMN reductase